MCCAAAAVAPARSSSRAQCPVGYPVPSAKGPGVWVRLQPVCLVVAWYGFVVAPRRSSSGPSTPRAWGDPRWQAAPGPSAPPLLLLRKKTPMFSVQGPCWANAPRWGWRKPRWPPPRPPPHRVDLGLGPACGAADRHTRVPLSLDLGPRLVNMVPLCADNPTSVLHRQHHGSPRVCRFADRTACIAT